MNRRPRGRTAILTGAASGIGRARARQLGGEDATVAMLNAHRRRPFPVPDDAALITGQTVFVNGSLVRSSPGPG